jgi:hypothetical protein
LKTATITMTVLLATMAGLVTGCGTSAGGSKSSPTPTISTDTAAAAIQSAVAAECTKFQAVNTEIEQATSADHTVGDLMDRVSTDAITWSKELRHAANFPRCARRG